MRIYKRLGDISETGAENNLIKKHSRYGLPIIQPPVINLPSIHVAITLMGASSFASPL